MNDDPGFQCWNSADILMGSPTRIYHIEVCAPPGKHLDIGQLGSIQLYDTTLYPLLAPKPFFPTSLLDGLLIGFVVVASIQVVWHGICLVKRWIAYRERQWNEDVAQVRMEAIRKGQKIEQAIEYSMEIVRGRVGTY